MERTGYADLPLHGGKCPRWLFQRMEKLARVLSEIIVYEFGPAELLARLSDPFFFQALGCVLGFDWHSSGVTTTVCGALKEGLKDAGKDLGVFVAGGKGGTSRKTPVEIDAAGRFLSIDASKLIYASKMSAKVDNTALQDGFQLYHHCFIFTKDGKWATVQQGMNDSNHKARRYHWLGEAVKDFVNEPHSAICCDTKTEVLDLTASESAQARDTSAEQSRRNPDAVLEELKKIQSLAMPEHHPVLKEDINPDRLYKTFIKTYERQPQNFEALLSIEGVGPKTVRALALISELVYGSAASRKDPARFSFAHGGKDGFPFPVDRKVYDRSIQILRAALDKAKLEDREKLGAFRRLQNF